MENFEFRYTERKCHCKVCDEVVERHTEKVIYFRTFRGHGDPTHICTNCLKKMYDKASEEIIWR